MTPPEQTNIVSALTFELSKVETVAVRTRMLGHLDLIEPDLGKRVAAAMAMTGQAEKITPAVAPRDDLKPSPALSLVGQGAEDDQGPHARRPGHRRQRCQGGRSAAEGAEEGRRASSS